MNLPSIRPWHEYTVLGVVDSSDARHDSLIGHQVMVVRELPLPKDLECLPLIRVHKMRHVEIFHNEQLGCIIAKLSLVVVPCRCDRKPFPHRWTKKCLADRP